MINFDPISKYTKFPPVLSHRSADKLTTSSSPKLLLKYFIFNNFWKADLIVSTSLFFVENNRPRPIYTDFSNWSVDELIYLHLVESYQNFWQDKYSCGQGCVKFIMYSCFEKHVIWICCADFNYFILNSVVVAKLENCSMLIYI